MADTIHVEFQPQDMSNIYLKVLIGWVWVCSNKTLMLKMIVILSVLEVLVLLVLPFILGYHWMEIIVKLSPFILIGIFSIYLSKIMINTINTKIIRIQEPRNREV